MLDKEAPRPADLAIVGDETVGERIRGWPRPVSPIFAAAPTAPATARTVALMAELTKA
jgi:hypothetical protein